MRAYLLMKKFLFIAMEIGVIYVVVHIYLQLEKLEKLLSLLKFQEHTGEEIQIMKCYKEFTEHAGRQKKN